MLPLLRRATHLAPLAAVLAAAVAFTRLLASVGGGSDRLPRWDEARHGLDGVRLADAVRTLDPLRFISDLWGMAYWPPAYPLIELPAFLWFGSAPGVARALMSGVFGACLVAAFLAGASLGGKRGILVGLLSAALLSASPFLQHYGTIVMLELPGALLNLLAFAAYARYLDTRRARDLRLAGAATLLLFFCKYNFGILWIAAVAVYEIWESAAWRAWGEVPSRWRRMPTRSRAFLVFLGVYLGFLGAIVATGGWIWELGGAHISVRKLGNPASILAAILLVRFLLRPRWNIARVRAWLDSLAPRHRFMATWVLLPMAAWLLLPPHTSAFFNFVQNRPAERSLLENLLLYPREFMAQYASSPFSGLLILVVALLPVFWIRRQPPRERLLTLALTVAFVATAAHRLKETRFLLVVTPLIWLSFSRVVIALLARATGEFERPRHTYTLAAIALGCLVLLQPTRVDVARSRDSLERFTISPDVRPVLDLIHRTARSSNGTVLLGLWDGLSPNLVEWHARIEEPGIDARRIARGPNRRARLGDPGRFLDELARDEETETILLLGLAGAPVFSAGFRAESRWLAPVEARLEQDSRFELQSETEFERAGYSLRVFRRSG